MFPNQLFNPSKHTQLCQCTSLGGFRRIWIQLNVVFAAMSRVLSTRIQLEDVYIHMIDLFPLLFFHHLSSLGPLSSYLDPCQ
uniref:Uncharacterized protein n=1 Tax=Arundo donax TaxID=35708 RepID=A0A0A9E105_ARUDO